MKWKQPTFLESEIWHLNLFRNKNQEECPHLRKYDCTIAKKINALWFQVFVYFHFWLMFNLWFIKGNNKVLLHKYVPASNKSFLQDFSSNDFVISLTNIRHNFWFFPTWLVFKRFSTKVKGSTMARNFKLYPKIIILVL